MTRPTEIIWFERIFLGTVALGAVHSWLSWSELTQLASPFFILTVQLFTFGLMIALTLFASRRRSKVARAIIIALYVLGLPMFVKQLWEGSAPGSLPIFVAQTVGQAIALGLLFTPGGRQWFRRREPQLEDVFS